MSRSALWRTEAHAQERERESRDAFLTAVEEGRLKASRTKGLVPLHGPDDSFNLNPMLLQNISRSGYFAKCCREINEWSRLVDEIYYEVKHLEPWTLGASKMPSTAFCLLLRLLTLRCSEKQMKLMLDHVDSPYIRCIGFLYLRFACDPRDLWNWVHPYLYDDELVRVVANQATPETTVGDFVRSLFQDMNYHGTLLPRLPVNIERDIKVKLLQAKQMEERAQENLKDARAMTYFSTLGSRVRALYGDEENPVTWYDAVVDRVITKDEATGTTLSRPKFVVTFPEYGNTETVSLGELEMPGRGGVGPDQQRRDGRFSYNGYDNDRRGRHSDSRGSGKGYEDDGNRGAGYERLGLGGRERCERESYLGSRERSSRDDRENSKVVATEKDLMEEVLRVEREKIVTNKKSSYASRPPSTKASLAAATTSGGHDSPPSPPDRSYSHQQRLDLDQKPKALQSPKRKTPEELAAIEAKKRKLLAKYG